MDSRTDASAAALTRLPFGADVHEVMTAIRRDGGLVLEGAMSPAQVARINADLDSALAEIEHCEGIEGEGTVRPSTLGERTKRLIHCAALSKTYREQFLGDPRTLAYIRAYLDKGAASQWLFSSQAIEIFPGQVAQILHRDQEIFPISRHLPIGGPEILCNMIMGLMPVTEEIGATRIIPGSHLWPDFADKGDPSMTIPVELNPGDVFFYGGKVVHGGGANVSADRSRRVLASAFCPGYLVPQEAYPFVIDVEQARAMSPQVQGLLGFKSFEMTEGKISTALWLRNMGPLQDALGL